MGIWDLDECRMRTWESISHRSQATPHDVMSTKRGNPLTKAERLCVHVCVYQNFFYPLCKCSWCFGGSRYKSCCEDTGWSVAFLFIQPPPVKLLHTDSGGCRLPVEMVPLLRRTNRQTGPCTHSSSLCLCLSLCNALSTSSTLQTLGSPVAPTC